MLKAKLKEILYTACLYFTVLVFILHILGSLTVKEELHMPLGNLALLFLFSFGMALAGLVWQAKKLPVALRFLVHYACFLFFFWGVFIFIGKMATKPSTQLIVMVLVSFVYILLAALLLAVKAYFQRRNAEK